MKTGLLSDILNSLPSDSEIDIVQQDKYTAKIDCHTGEGIVTIEGFDFSPMEEIEE